MQIHTVISYEGAARRVLLGQEYIEGTITRDVLPGNGDLEPPDPQLVLRRDPNNREAIFNPATDTLDVCDPIYAEVEAEPGSYDGLGYDWAAPPEAEVELPDAAAPAINLNTTEFVPTNRQHRIQATPLGGTYDTISYRWDIIGPGEIGSGDSSRTYIPPRRVRRFTNVTVICIATVTGTGTNAKAGTTATARVAQTTFQVLNG